MYVYVRVRVCVCVRKTFMRKEKKGIEKKKRSENKYLFILINRQADGQIDTNRSLI